jgi:YidC/Oxa1 family membrane protein insertase
MEKNVVLAIALSIGLFVLYMMFFGQSAPPPRQPTPATPGAPSTEGAPAAPAVRKPLDAPESPDQKLSNENVDFVVASRGGALKSAAAWGCLYHRRGDASVLGDPGETTDWVPGMPGALAVDFVTSSTDVPDLPASHWKLSSAADGAVVATIDAAGWKITKTLRFAGPWDATASLEFANVDATGTAPTFEVVGPSPPPPPQGTAPLGDDGVVYGTAGDDADVTSMSAADVLSKVLDKPGLELPSPTGRWGFIAARANFFVGALAPLAPLPEGTRVGFRTGMRPNPSGKGPAVPTAAATFRIPVDAKKGESRRFDFMYFAGPSRRALLQDETSRYHPLAGATSSRGFLGIKLTWITQVMAWVLAALMSAGMSAGLAVISLTILVRGAMFPLSRKSQISMRLHGQKMQRLKPKLDAIKEKHKDPRKQQEATMKVMREEKVSILPGGCLLAFLQMPIWIALFNVLQTTFEMRHASFLWVKDLTAPDRFLHLPFTEGWWILDGWLNLLPILMMATWYFSAAMQPLPADPQQAQTAKMMRWMPVLMGIFLYAYPAGLALYMTMSALWSIGETWLIRKVWLAKMEKALS